LPTLLRKAGYIFEMVMFDCRERRHAHVRGNGSGGAKIWLEPAIEVASPGGYNARQIEQVLGIVRKNLDTMVARWGSRRGGRKAVMVQAAIVRDARVDDDLITFVLADGREVSAPTSWSFRLSGANRKQRENFEIEPDGLIVGWPELDEHIGVWTLLGISEEDALSAAGFKIFQPV
jgi:hypothetical protein